MGTVPYMSPEAINCEPLDMANDVYGFSMVLYELRNTECQFPWEDLITKEHRSFESIKTCVKQGERPQFQKNDHGMPQEFVALIKKFWSQLPTDRPIMSDVVKEQQTMYNAESNSDQGEEEIPNTWNTPLSAIHDNFSTGNLSVHQGYALDLAGQKTVSTMGKNEGNSNKVMQEIGQFLIDNDARNACVFLSLC